MFVGSLIVIVIAWGLWSTRNIDRMEYIKSDDFKGIAKGVLIALAFAVGVGSLVFFSPKSEAVTFFNDASVFAGLDYTKKLSPSCKNTGPDNHTTSNLGLRLNLLESDDSHFRINSKYTHHSCAFSPDDRQYDAVGVELEYKFWSN